MVCERLQSRGMVTFQEALRLSIPIPEASEIVIWFCKHCRLMSRCSAVIRCLSPIQNGNFGAQLPLHSLKHHISALGASCLQHLLLLLKPIQRFCLSAWIHSRDVEMQSAERAMGKGRSGERPYCLLPLGCSFQPSFKQKLLTLIKGVNVFAALQIWRPGIKFHQWQQEDRSLYLCHAWPNRTIAQGNWMWEFL